MELLEKLAQTVALSFGQYNGSTNPDVAVIIA
jgi:hypothetical protein